MSGSRVDGVHRVEWVRVSRSSAAAGGHGGNRVRNQVPVGPAEVKERKQRRPTEWTLPG
ncbi:hypothetical protein GCM10018987_10770 [Streptomyces cremeus]